MSTKPGAGHGDILIVEVRSQTAKDSDIGGSEETNHKFDFTPLDSLGVSYEEEKLSYQEAINRSSIPNSKTTMASYRDFHIPGEEEKVQSAYLSYIHVYDQEKLKLVMADIGFEVLDTFFNVPGIACYVLKKPLSAV